MYTHDLIPGNFAELAEAVLIGCPGASIKFLFNPGYSYGGDFNMAAISHERIHLRNLAWTFVLAFS